MGIAVVVIVAIAAIRMVLVVGEGFPGTLTTGGGLWGRRRGCHDRCGLRHFIGFRSIGPQRWNICVVVAIGMSKLRHARRQVVFVKVRQGCMGNDGWRLMLFDPLACQRMQQLKFLVFTQLKLATHDQDMTGDLHETPPKTKKRQLNSF